MAACECCGMPSGRLFAQPVAPLAEGAPDVGNLALCDPCCGEGSRDRAWRWRYRPTAEPQRLPDRRDRGHRKAGPPRVNATPKGSLK